MSWDGDGEWEERAWGWDQLVRGVGGNHVYSDRKWDFSSSQAPKRTPLPVYVHNNTGMVVATVSARLAFIARATTKKG